MQTQTQQLHLHLRLHLLFFPSLRSLHFLLKSKPFQSLLIWLSLSLLVGPFAPISLTGGDVCVGCGSIIEFAIQEVSNDIKDSKKCVSQRRSRACRSEDIVVGLVKSVKSVIAPDREEKKNRGGGGGGNGVVVMEEKDWNEEEIEVLRKQMVKNPMGKPRRWEVIVEVFNDQHEVESVIKKANELGEKKVDDADSYARFLKKRKSVDKRLENDNDNENFIFGWRW